MTDRLITTAAPPTAARSWQRCAGAAGCPVQRDADRSPSAASTVDPLVQLIRSEPGMAERLLGAHTDDGTGRCRVCSTGAQTGRVRWPCTIHHRAQQAHHDASHPVDATSTTSDR